MLWAKDLGHRWAYLKTFRILWTILEHIQTYLGCFVPIWLGWGHIGTLLNKNFGEKVGQNVHQKSGTKCPMEQNVARTKSLLTHAGDAKTNRLVKIGFQNGVGQFFYFAPPPLIREMFLHKLCCQYFLGSEIWEYEHKKIHPNQPDDEWRGPD